MTKVGQLGDSGDVLAEVILEGNQAMFLGFANSHALQEIFIKQIITRALQRENL